MVITTTGSTIYEHSRTAYAWSKLSLKSATTPVLRRTERSSSPRSAALPPELPPLDQAVINYGLLTSLVGYQVRKAYSRLFQTFTEMLQDLSLAPGQYSALLLIGLNPGLSQMALADATGIDRSTIVPITNRFARSGWIRRTRRNDDRRVYSLRLTPQGQAILDRARPIIRAHEVRLVAGLSEAERAMATALLMRIADSEFPQSTANSKAKAWSPSTAAVEARSRTRRRGRKPRSP
jgi:DNA-binding MarR family transcriptional regulator